MMTALRTTANKQAVTRHGSKKTRGARTTRDKRWQTKKGRRSSSPTRTISDMSDDEDGAKSTMERPASASVETHDTAFKKPAAKKTK
eukprot:8043115-Pyramimonas_sp.AAC.1